MKLVKRKVKQLFDFVFFVAIDSPTVEALKLKRELSSFEDFSFFINGKL